jgi:hypothetical protein
MVQTLNLILLTASELHGLRSILSKSLMKLEDGRRQWAKLKSTSIDDASKVFATLFR